ncbi:aromatic amino acid ammonia-lyase [Actinomadura sp. ATCC 31491]|uniref:Aromatic amino acid ammonia-lyase n=1 Tax=Actinomadura luzonensis TaxID=2805427 RepID=A0ABT0FM46_9ACTN|nr:aromatic amino acid ammonia-lyase [Actinomadura luzonensis]MCK2213416.1 aromatic amino acid ammonia-lyase [Actinomadura luzonensis]
MKLIRAAAGTGLLAALCVVPGQAAPGQAAPGRAVAEPPAAARQAASLVLDGGSFSVADAFAILEGRPVTVRLAPAAQERMRRSRAGALAALERGGQRVYGWNQALGPLKDRPLDPAQAERFQRNVLRSHAAGVGPPFPDGVARLAMVIKANQMARGRYGVRPEVAQRLLDLVNAGVVPRMPQIGSLGTGDLQPQAAMGLAMIGEQAPVRYRGAEGPAAAMLPRAGLARTFTLQAGEALPIVSGSTTAAASFLDAVRRATVLAGQAEGAFALFMEATRAERGSLDARTHAERHIPEENAVAARLRELVAGSGWMTEEGRRRLDPANYEPRVQDAVSVRAAPHVLAGLWHELADARRALLREANSSTSNPLVFRRAGGRYEFVMGGNWDASVMGHLADSLNAEVADVGVLSQELSGRLLSPRWSYGLPANLAGGSPGLNSGLVQAQTVAAALVPEMQVRAHPAGTLSRPVKDGQEDHNTMAMASLRHLHENLDRLEVVLAVQYLMAAQGVDLIAGRMAGLPLGAGTRALHAELRRSVAPLGDDRYLTPDLERVIGLIHAQRLAPR